MIHHESISAKLASQSGGAGHFDVFEDDRKFSVYGEGFCYGFGFESLESATKRAGELATRYDEDKLDELKRQWAADPHWDIEGTEGYEAFEQELLIYRLQYERDAARKELSRVQSILTSFAVTLKESLPAGI